MLGRETPGFPPHTGGGFRVPCPPMQGDVLDDRDIRIHLLCIMDLIVLIIEGVERAAEFVASLSVAGGFLYYAATVLRDGIIKKI